MNSFLVVFSWGMFFFLFHLVYSSYLWKKCRQSNVVVRNVGEWLISGTVEQGVLGLIPAFFFFFLEAELSKQNLKEKLQVYLIASTSIMYFSAHYSVHRRESIFYHVPRIYVIISVAVEANTSGKIILWMVFSASPKILFKSIVPS